MIFFTSVLKKVMHHHAFNQRSILDLMWVSWALGRDSNKCYFNPCLYASSGPLCGPGTGFDSQIVVWVALDMWNKAKSLDPAAAPEANKFIRRYAQYMPNKEDIFIRGLKEGGTFKVPCWIQRNTVIRAAK